MGQKVNPIGLRLGIDSLNSWGSCWYADKKDYPKMLHQDLIIRNSIKRLTKGAGVGKVTIERIANRVAVTINAAKPGVIIGSSGKGIGNIKKVVDSVLLNGKVVSSILRSNMATSSIIDISGKKKIEKNDAKEVNINVVELKKPDLDASVLAQNIAQQLEKRVAFRKVAKRSILMAMRSGAEGVKIKISGRIGGAEIARDQKYSEGRVPLHTLRMMIDYSTAEAFTTYGIIGVKVWICRGRKSSSGIS